MIGIRADANKIIASGHVMRCITIAKELVALGESVTFFVADNEGKSLVDSVGKELDHFEVVVLGRAYDHMEDEEREEMEAEQRFVMEKLGIPRE